MDNLTNYDRFLLNRKNNKAAEQNKAVIGSESNDYHSYMLRQLYRTKPEEGGIMTESQYLASLNSVSSEAAIQSEKVEEVKEEAPVEKVHKIRLKKRGKIFLGIYVILILALASILIAGNAGKTNSFEAVSQIAGAAPSVESTEKGTIRAMTVEEEASEESNWFDRLCDSLNK